MKIDLHQIIRERIEKIESQIGNAAEERNEKVASQLFNSLLEEKKGLYAMLAESRKFSTMYTVKSSTSAAETSFFVVPDGLGGMIINDTLLVGVSSPIGQILQTKKIGDTYRFNNYLYKVVGISENSD